MGHFGRPPIRRAWFLLVFPALTLNYLGQGSLILEIADGDRQPVLPAHARTGRAIPMVAARDARDGDRLAGRDLGRVLGHAPGRAARASCRGCTIRHTSEPRWPGLRAGGQLAACSSPSSRSWSASAPRQALASAYGIAVTGTLAIDTILFFVVVRMLWQQAAVARARAAPRRSCSSTSRSSPRTCRRSSTAAGFRCARARRLHAADDLAARPRASSPPSAPRRRGCCATSSRRSRAIDPPVYRAPGHRGLPERQQGDDAARAARERRPQPRRCTRAS